MWKGHRQHYQQRLTMTLSIISVLRAVEDANNKEFKIYFLVGYSSMGESASTELELFIFIFIKITMDKWQLGNLCRTHDYSNISKPLLDLQ